MSIERKKRRDTEANIAAVTPALAEMGFDTTNKLPLVGDGLKQGGFKIRTMKAAQEQLGVALTVAGSGSPVDFNTLTGSSGSANSGFRRAAYVTNERIGFFAPGTSDGAVTIDRDGLGAKALERNGGALAGGELVEDRWYEAVYDGTAYQIVVGIDSFSTGLLHVRHEEAANTGGGTFTSGSWQTRPLNTVKTNEIGASLATNQITLPAGTYYIDAILPTFGVTRHVAKLANITDTADTIIGSAEGQDGSDPSGNSSHVRGRFTIAAEKVFELQHRCVTTQGTTGFGQPVNVGVAEVYADVTIWKVA